MIFGWIIFSENYYFISIFFILMVTVIINRKVFYIELK